MCAPSSVGAIEPVGMTNASTTNPRKMNARMNAIRIDSIVSLMLPSLVSSVFAGCLAGTVGAAGALAVAAAGADEFAGSSFIERKSYARLERHQSRRQLRLDFA